MVGVARGFVVTTSWTLEALVGQHAKDQKPKGRDGKSGFSPVPVILYHPSQLHVMSGALHRPHRLHREQCPLVGRSLNYQAHLSPFKTGVTA